MRIETRARSRALQALYAWDVRGERDLLRIGTQVFDDLSVGPEERRLAGMILRTIASSIDQVDRELTDVTTNWRLERLGAIERSVLRMGVAELMREETPPRVVIQEAVRLTERYAGPQSARFVNGVLDALARRMGRL
jgi:transcription antitermination protein NusB